jgi:O-antigen ligase
MSKLKYLTENRYTLSDIFPKSHEVWLATPLFCYLLTPIVHMIVYAVRVRPHTLDISTKDLAHLLTTGEGIGNLQIPIVQGAFCLSLLLAIVAWISHAVYARQTHLRPTTDIIPMFFFTALCAIVSVSAAVQHTPKAYVLGFTVRAEGTVVILLYFLVYYLCGSMIRKEKIKYAVIGFFLSTAFVIGVMSLIDFFIVKIPIFSPDYFTVIFRHRNFYSYYLTMVIALSAGLFTLEKNRAVKALSLVSFLLNCAVLAFNDSFGGFLACLVALTFLIVAASIKKRKFSFGALSMLLIFLAVCFVVGLKYQSFFSEVIKLGSDVEKIATNAEDADNAGTARWGLWRATAGYIKERPFFGHGFEGTVQRLLNDTAQEKVHNEYLDYMVDFGIPAGLIYIGGLVSIFIKALKRRAHVDNVTLICLTASLGYIASAFVGNRMVYVIPFFFIFLGLANNTHGQYAKLAPDGETQTEETAENEEAVTPAADEPTEKAEEAEAEIVAESIENTGIGETDDV